MGIGRDGGRSPMNGLMLIFPRHLFLFVRNDPQDFKVNDKHDDQWDVEGGHRGVDLVPGSKKKNIFNGMILTDFGDILGKVKILII